MAVTREQARNMRNPLGEMLKGVKEVTGIGVTKVGDNYAVKVNLQKEVPAGTVPEEIAGVRVVVEVVGFLSARDI